MNFKKMFEMQKTLDNHIMEEHPELKGQDNLNWKVLALLVEVGECANEWRGFKKWSNDQKPRIHKSRAPYMDLDEADFYNPLLEEYVDGFHFVLSIGNELGFQPDKWVVRKADDITHSFLTVMDLALKLVIEPTLDNYSLLFKRYKELGKMLGFTQEQVEEAYMAKNAINHKRQEQGY